MKGPHDLKQYLKDYVIKTMDHARHNARHDATVDLDLEPRPNTILVGSVCESSIKGNTITTMLQGS